jgi:hypothetical protein
MEVFLVKINMRRSLVGAIWLFAVIRSACASPDVDELKQERFMNRLFEFAESSPIGDLFPILRDVKFKKTSMKSQFQDVVLYEYVEDLKAVGNSSSIYFSDLSVEQRKNKGKEVVSSVVELGFVPTRYCVQLQIVRDVATRRGHELVQDFGDVHSFGVDFPREGTPGYFNFVANKMYKSNSVKRKRVGEHLSVVVNARGACLTGLTVYLGVDGVK